MREIKFRVWDISREEMVDDIRVHGMLNKTFEKGNVIFMQYTGLKDKDGVEIYEGDICKFDNGDKFLVCVEDWLEAYVEWIGSVECEDQARDLYRISNSTIIGNKYQNPELLG